jgi:hypothetical protein
VKRRSLLNGLLILTSGIANAGSIFSLIAFVIVGSMSAHSSTDVLIARWFGKPEEAKSEEEEI